MKNGFITYVGFSILSLLFSCNGQQESNRQSDANKKIIIKGSDTEYLMVKELAEAYMASHPDIEILVEGGGSNEGILGLIEHEADICNSSRELSNAELLAFEHKNEKVLPIMFSVDALAIITNYKVGVDSLSVEQIGKLFSGEIKNWQELGGENQPVKLFGRDKTSGTRDYFSRKILAEQNNGKITECISNASILDSVIKTQGGLGYVGAGFLLDSIGKPNGKIWAMPVYIKGSQAVSPYQIAAVKKGDYVLTRPLYQYINDISNETVKDFIYFELTKVGQDIVTKHGFFPINDYQTQINRLKGLIN